MEGAPRPEGSAQRGGCALAGRPRLAWRYGREAVCEAMPRMEADSLRSGLARISVPPFAPASTESGRS